MLNAQSTPAPAASLSLPNRDRVLILVSIALTTVLAWAYLVHLSREMSAKTDYGKAMAAMGMAAASSWTASDVFLTFAMWLVMMIGMMAPSAAPVLLLFAATIRNRANGAWLGANIFGSGYLCAWAAFSAVAVLAQWFLHHEAVLSMSMAATSRYVAGAILIAAGVYQLTPWKDRCLSHCRSPLGFLLSNWRDGPLGAIEMGFRHGIYCLGCCWALMCVLFVAGVMNLLAVAALTILVLLEKTGPRGALIARLAGGGLILLGVVTVL